MTEPTGILTFGDLILEAALEMGVAYFGADGTEAAQVPIDAHDLAEVKRHANNAIRMLYSNGPPGGWRWRRPTASISIWPTVAVDSDVTITGGSYDSVNDQTILTVSAATFYNTMETKSIVITGIGTFTMKSYTSATVMVVTGDASTASADTFSIASNGDFTLPQSFSGAYTGDITYEADTNQAINIEWSNAGTIRSLREDNLNTNFPSLAAIQVQSDKRRWNLMTWPVPSSVEVLEFDFPLYFAVLTAVTDLPPMPFAFDEVLRAAVLYIIERDVHKQLQGQYQDYYIGVALPSAWSEDQRAAPKRLGRFGNPNRPVINANNFRDFRSKPTVNTDNI